ncbi:uncharacterized protein KIAA2012 homolog [Hemicordylus capensis]|uniref:uncharacterized protein KIAA2012 homolog n=1 Tax=Hemicordylus capensis TaxID=884348 RepID=UPI0023043A16|nr:uncharacterized protein KIAA2012 homolog [Hemicordylus capensis]
MEASYIFRSKEKSHGSCMCTNFNMSSLSLLSRGTGQVVRKTQEKLEVHFNPEDYLKWKSPESYCHVSSRLLDDSPVLEGYWGLYLPKTYSTRTGALALYSEDLAKPSRKLKGFKQSQKRLRNKSWTLHIELHTLQDLVRAILAYGGKQLYKGKKDAAWQPYLHFLSDPDVQSGRQMRPGYSAKRYLLKLSQTWDPSILRKLQCSGYIRDPLLLEEKSQDHRKKQQDLSVTPPKYNLQILCSPCPYVQTESEQQINPGLDPSSHKQSENEAWLVEGNGEEKHARRRARLPLRVSVRRLSFHLRPPHTKETTWRQNAAHKEILEDTWVGVHQDGKTATEDQGHSEIPNPSVEHPALENASIDASKLWCEKSHVTFYGGFFPGRKIAYSISQKHLKNPDSRERGPFFETTLFPPIQPDTNTEQSGVRKEHRKQVPEIFRLPQISEDSPKAQREKLKSSELSKELLVLPLLIQLEREPKSQVKKLAGECCNEPKSEVVVCEKPLAPLLNNLISEPEHRNKQPQAMNGGIPEAPPGSFCLPPIKTREFVRNGKMTRKREVCAEKDSKYQRDGDLFLQDAVPASDQLPAIDPRKCSGNKSNRANFNAGISDINKDLPEGISLSALPEECRECSKDTSVSSLIMGPDRKMICPSLLGSVQSTDNLGHLEFIPDEEGAGVISLKRRVTVSINPPEASFAAQELDEKEIPKTQVGEVQGNKKALENEQRIMGNASTEFRQKTQQSQGGLCGNSHLLQSKQKKGHSRLPQTQSTKRRDGDDAKQDTGKQLDNLSRSDSLSHLEPHFTHSTISISDMERVPGPESDSALIEPDNHRKEIKEHAIMGISSSEKQFGIKEDETILQEKTNKQEKATSLNTAEDVFENKPVTRQKKQELAKTRVVYKAQKKNPKKDKQQKRSEFVVGKPNQKKAVGKRVSYPKERPEDTKVLLTTKEPNQGQQKGEADAEVERITSHGEGDEELGGTSDPSSSPPSPLKEPLPLEEEDLLSPLPLEEDQTFTEDVDHPSESLASPVSERFTVNSPIVSGTAGPQSDVIQRSGIQEVLPENKQEEKLSRERLIAERAEQRRLAVERKRREQDELKRRQQEQQEQIERMKEEMAQEQLRRIEEIRLRKKQLEEERQRQEEETARKLQAEKAAQDRLRQQQEELRRKLLEMQKKKQQEERERAEAEKRRQKEREMWLEEERQRLAEMAEEQRLEYEKRKWEEEEKARCQAEERRKKAEEAARLALEEARKQAILLARQRAELEEKQCFQYKLLEEASGLERGQDISRPWVYSYFQHPFTKVGDDD